MRVWCKKKEGEEEEKEQEKKRRKEDMKLYLDLYGINDEDTLKIHVEPDIKFLVDSLDKVKNKIEKFIRSFI